MTNTVSGIKMVPGESEKRLKAKAAKRLGISPDRITRWKILKKSLDARKKNDIHYVYSVEVSTDPPDQLPAEENRSFLPKQFAGIIPQDVPSCPVPRPVIVGFGPAGMFAGLILARLGLKPLIIERGQPVEKRREAVERFRKTGILSPESNVQFGEGGAGTFSDGKLNTGTHDGRISFVLNEFYRHGAEESVTYDAKPHIGTDVLVRVVRSFREEILSLGGTLCFETRLDDLMIENGTLTGITVSGPDGSEEIPCRALILAAGHSARDTFVMLRDRGVPMERKTFSMGARIEHSRRMINSAQYGADRDDLPAADYSLSVHFPDGTSAYSFCMCPGGYVFAAASEEGGVCTNGMSYSGRNGENSNAALLVNIYPEDLPGEDVLAGMLLQRETERKAYEYGLSEGKYFATAQLAGDFLAGQASRKGGKITPSYEPGVKWGDIREILPEKTTAVLSRALPEFGRKIRGFDDPDAVLTAPETRSSSPVRILRGENCESEITGLFPCGEGAGYAGGITSAAVDGIRCAEAVVRKLFGVSRDSSQE